MISHNETELIALGKQLGKLIEKQDVIILSGDLGAGKTTFTKGIAKGLGVDQMIKARPIPLFVNTKVACLYTIWMFTGLGMIQILLI